jgi:hypothetical protein
LSHHIWQKTLDQLRLQMTRATFDTWLQGTGVVSTEADHYQIAVKNEMAQEWLDKRLHETVQRTLKNFAGEAATVEFVVAAEPLLSLCPPCPPCPPQDAPFQYALPQDSSALAQVDYQQLWNSTGFIKLDHYANTFWRRYLGRAFELWLYLQSHPMSREYLEQGWTPSRKYRFREMAQALKASPNSVKGAEENCYYLRLAAELDQPLTTCCGRFHEVRWEPNSERSRCMHWRTGWLEMLFAEGLVAVEEVKSPHKPRAHVLKLQAWRILPLLTPFQVSRLSEGEQERHDRWLEKYGHLATPPVTLRCWEAETARSLVPLLTEPPYKRGRTNFDIYQPNTLKAHYSLCVHEDTIEQNPEGFCIHEDANGV